MNHAAFNYAADAILDERDFEHINKSATPFVANGILYVPAGDIASGSGGGHDGSPGSALLMLAIPGCGLFASFTPDGARAFAQKMLESAAIVDGNAKRIADDLLGKAGKA